MKAALIAIVSTSVALADQAFLVEDDSQTWPEEKVPLVFRADIIVQDISGGVITPAWN